MPPFKTALSKAPGNKLAQGLTRVSPGVYRNAQGQLTNPRGQVQPRPQAPAPQPSGPSFRAPAPLPQGQGFGQGFGQGAAPVGNQMYRFQPGEAPGMGPLTQLRPQAPAPFRSPMPQPSAPLGQGFGQGIGIGKGIPEGGVTEEARSRAETLAGGGVVTQDFHPERDALVDQYLEQMRQGQPMQSAPMGAPYQPGRGFGQGLGQGIAGLVKNPLRRF